LTSAKPTRFGLRGVEPKDKPFRRSTSSAAFG
jgi:hypothetical protein